MNDRSLTHAAFQGDLRTVLQSIEQGADVNQADPSGITPLQNAIEGGNLQIMAALLESWCRPES